jgi:hypothetical protein
VNSCGCADKKRSQREFDNSPPAAWEDPVRKLLMSVGCLCLVVLSGCRTGLGDALNKSPLSASRAVPEQYEPPLDDASDWDRASDASDDERP